GIERLGPGGRRGDRAQDPGVAGNVEGLAGGIAHAAEAHGRAEILHAPGDRDGAGRGGGNVLDVEQPFRRLGRDDRETRRPVRDAVAVFEAVEELSVVADVGGAAWLRHHVAVGPAGDRLFEIGAAEAGHQRVHADPALTATEVELLEPRAHYRPRGRLAVGGHGVLEVEDQAVGGQR